RRRGRSASARKGNRRGSWRLRFYFLHFSCSEGGTLHGCTGMDASGYTWIRLEQQCPEPIPTFRAIASPALTCQQWPPWSTPSLNFARHTKFLAASFMSFGARALAHAQLKLAHGT